MSVVRNILILVIAAELMGVAYLAAGRLRRIEPPPVNLQRLDPLAASELEQLQDRARNGTGADWRILGESYLGNGYYVAAEQCFRQVVQRHPGDVTSLYAQGFCLERIGQTAEAARVLQQTAVVADAELSRTCWYQVGRCYLRQENAEQAEKAFRKIIEFPPAAYQLARLLIRSGRADEAVPLLELHLAEAPRSLKLIQMRRLAAEALGEAELAARLQDRELRSEYTLVLEYSQNFISMFAQRTGLSRLLSRAMQLKTEGTLQHRKRALDAALEVILPNELWQYRSVMLAAAHVELGLGHLARARELADLIEQHTHADADLLDLQALLAQAEGDSTSALEHWTRAAELKPAFESYRILAESPVKIDDALRDRYSALADMHAGIAFWRRDMMEAAAESLERARGPLEQNATLHFYLGETHRVMDNIEKAQASYEACLRIDPDHGRCLLRLGQLQNARSTGGT